MHIHVARTSCSRTVNLEGSQGRSRGAGGGQPAVDMGRHSAPLITSMITSLSTGSAPLHHTASPLSIGSPYTDTAHTACFAGIPWYSLALYCPCTIQLTSPPLWSHLPCPRCRVFVCTLYRIGGDCATRGTLLYYLLCVPRISPFSHTAGRASRYRYIDALDLCTHYPAISHAALPLSKHAHSPHHLDLPIPLVTVHRITDLLSLSQSGADRC
jgi:hypothetical protein